MTAAAGLSFARPCRKLNRIVTGDKRAFRPDDTLRAAGDQMRALHAEAWPVVENETLVGVIDRPNPDWRAQAYGHDPNEARVAGCMNPDVAYCYDDDDCTEALRIMMERHFHHVPVTDHEMHFVGIVSLDEILSALIAVEEEEREGMA